VNEEMRRLLVAAFLMSARAEARSVLLLVVLPDLAVLGVDGRLDALDVRGDGLPDLVVVVLLAGRHLGQTLPVSLILFVLPTHGSVVKSAEIKGRRDAAGDNASS